MRGWLAFGLLSLLGCGDASVSVTSEVMSGRAVTWTEADGIDSQQCRVVVGDELVDTDNTSCGFLGEVLHDPWGLVADDGFSLQQVVLHDTAHFPTTLTGQNGAMLLVEGNELVQVDSDGTAHVLVHGTWQPRGLSWIGEGLVAVVTHGESDWLIKGPF